MGRKVAIGLQDFGDLIRKKFFYVDKTSFLKEWWESGDSVTLITRPRRFGKTLNISMTEQFFSVDYSGQGRIVKGIAGFYYVQTAESGVYECKAKGIFRKEKQKPMVGDQVEISVTDEEKKNGNMWFIWQLRNASGKMY